MFNQVASVYLTSFEASETARLLRDLGRPMLLDWQDGAVEEVQRLTGGFPYFVRDLASTVRQSIRADSDPEAVDPIEVSASDVRVGSQEWSGRAAEAWLGIVEALGIHYPSAATLLDISLSEDELNEWILADSDARDAAEDLLALKLFQRVDSRIKHSPTLAALRVLGMSRSGGLGADSVGIPDSLASLVRQGESQVLEFKETSRVNLHTMQKDGRIEGAVVKTVAAFLNSDGGDLLIGISDDGAAKGLDPDLSLFKGSTDRYERWIRGDLLAQRIDRQLVTDNVKTEFLTFRGKQVLRINVVASRRPAWVDDKTIYRRLGNQTVSLDGGRDIQQFISQRG